MSWKLLNAFPCKMTVSDMKADANEIAVETMELAHEGLSLSA
jgi:phage tail-like protein